MKSKFKFCTTAVILIFAIYNNVFGQEKYEKYKTETIYIKGNKYVKIEKEHPIGFWGQHLEKEMKVSPEAIAEYNVFVKKRKTAFILSSITFASVVSIAFVDDRNLKAGLFIGAVGLSITASPFSARAGESFHKAIWLRNGATLN